MWNLHADGRKQPASGNRNNDRWPFLLSSGYTAFSLWSRNREVITDDRGDLRPYSPGMACASQPTDTWLGAFTQIPGGHFGMLVKPAFPVWRPRPLFVNRITFMTTFASPGAYGDTPPLSVVQVPPGMLANVPSARSHDNPLPRSEPIAIRRGPDHDSDGRPLWLATPSPCPPSHVLLSGAAVENGHTMPTPGAYGIYLAADDWPVADQPLTPAQIDLKLLFDDPDYVDAEPVAIYERKLDLHEPDAAAHGKPPPASLTTPNGGNYSGSAGAIFATSLDSGSPMRDLPGQRTDSGQSPIFAAPPAGAIDHLRIYAAHRDRFDDPVKPRVPGSWEFICNVPVKNGAAAGMIPSDFPTVLAGFDKSEHVVRWDTPATDKQGRHATFYAYAGDHYSLAKPGGRTFCVGCHPGHSGLPPDSHKHAEIPP